MPVDGTAQCALAHTDGYAVTLCLYKTKEVVDGRDA